MVREKKGGWELMMVEKARSSSDHGKTTWKVNKKLSGKVKSETADIVVIDGVKTGIDGAWGNVTADWSGILQPRENNVLSTWEGGWEGGLKKRYFQEYRDRVNI